MVVQNAGIVIGEPGLGRCADSDVDECRGHRWLGRSGVAIDRAVAVASAVGDPTKTTAVGRRNKPRVTAGSNRVAREVAHAPVMDHAR